MSFDFSPNINLSNVQASHKTTDGGGGNTGYFQRGENSEEETNYVFKNNNETDSFSLSITIDDEEEKQDTGIIEKIKKFLIDLINNIKKVLKIK